MSAATNSSPFFFLNDTATTEIYTLSLHDALPILRRTEHHILRHDDARQARDVRQELAELVIMAQDLQPVADRKSTRLNSSHSQISYAVFCLKKKKKLMIALFR